MASNTDWSQLGTINQTGFWSVARLPGIVSEWAAIIPLVCHLANFRHGHQTVGQLALLGRISIGLFPKLGVLSGLADLLKTGPGFLDDASSKGSSSKLVWDVIWGGSFPCANGAASAALIEYALGQQSIAPQKMPDRSSTPLIFNAANLNDNHQKDLGSMASTSVSKISFRRYQRLHVLKFEKGRTEQSWIRRVETSISSLIGVSVLLVALFALTIVLSFFGIYGTAALVLGGAFAQMACCFYAVQRPAGYLKSNEQHASCCMLVATHQNVNNWYLFIGDRGIVDTLLNKTMLELPDTVYSRVLATVLTIAHGVQILGMTFVAAQKGWDGISLVVLMMVSWAFRWRYSNRWIARLWLEREGLQMRTCSYLFTGRTMMLGAIQKFSQSQTTVWMDDIVAPHARRDAWLGYLMKKSIPDASQWTDHDLANISRSAELADAAAQIMRKDQESGV